MEIISRVVSSFMIVSCRKMYINIVKIKVNHEITVKSCPNCSSMNILNELILRCGLFGVLGLGISLGNGG